MIFIFVVVVVYTFAFILEQNPPRDGRKITAEKITYLNIYDHPLHNILD